MLDMKEGFSKSSEYNFFKNNLPEISEKAYHWKMYWPFLYVKDVLYTLIWCIKSKKRFDIYFAVGNLNPIAGIILRKLRLVSKVIYISLDYYPIRFKNVFFNWLYFQLDKFCVGFCDETWNASPIIAKTREKKMNMRRDVYNKQYTVRGGVWFYKTKRLSFARINKEKIVYRGVLLDFMGVELAIKAMPLVLKKIPKLIFEIIGTGEEKGKLKKIVRSLKISKNVIFHGFVKGRQQMEKVLSDSAIGIATFNTDLHNEKVMNSDPGKIKDYMLMGMPVITTNAVYFHRELTRKKCGVIVEYKPEKLATAIIRLIKNRRLLKEYRQNAIKFIEKYDCSYIYKPNIERVLSN